MKDFQQQSFKHILLLFLILVSGAVTGFSQIETDGKGGIPENSTPAFEGSIRYNIRLSGKMATDILLTEPANRMDMHIKDQDFIVHLYGGQRGKTFLFISDSNHTYIIDAANQRYFLRDYFIDTTETIPVAVNTGRTEQVKKWECEIWKVQKPTQVIYYYVTDEFQVDISEFQGKDEAKANFLTRGLNGRIPLKTVMKQEGLTTEIELDFIKRKELESESFRIPETFKRKVRDHR